MNAGLDYDTLELLGAALRDERSCDVSDPLPSELRSLCERLGAEAPADEAGEASSDLRRR